MSPVHSIVTILFGFALASLLTGCSREPTATDPVLTKVLTKKDDRWNLPERSLKYCRLVDEAHASAIQTVENYLPKTSGQIDDLGLNVADILSELPGVIDVTGPKVDAPTQRIVHLIDHPLPTKEEFLIRLRGKADGGVSFNQLELIYDDYLQQIELMQAEQMVVLRCLIKHHGLRQVFAEGVTEANLPLYHDKIASLRFPGACTAEEVRKRRLDLLEFGAVGQLHITGELPEVLPVDDADFNVQSVMKRRLISTIDKNSIDDDKIQPRKPMEALDHKVQMILNHGNFGFIVGDDYDLTENVNRISGGKCEYIRVKTKWWNEISPLDPNVWGR